MDNYTGKRLDGRYEIQEVIGVGGMAVVYKAYDNIDDRIVAVKILKDEFLANEDFRRRFKNESKAISLLSHPNIVKVYNVNYGDRLQYIVMEHVEGITLKEYIAQQGRLGIKETIHFTMQILRALQHAHDKGIIHRDIKPQNILLLSNGNIKVTDFGIARFSYSDTKTMTDAAIGSVHYISPEQARGHSIDERTDVYSVGVVMYEMLTGRLPFVSDNSVSVALMQLQNDPKSIRELNPNIPVGLEQIVNRAMSKETKARYQTASEMLLDIEEFKRNPNIRFQQDYFVDTDPTKFAVNTNVNVPTAPAPVPAPPRQPLVIPDGDEHESRGNSKVGFIVMGVVIGLLVVGLISFAFFYFFTDLFTKSYDTVPNFVGLVYETDIQNNADYRGFEFELKTEPNSLLTDGTVFDQDPPADRKIENKDFVITLYVVDNEQPITVPDVFGMNWEKAQQVLEEKGFKVNLLPMANAVEDYGTVIKTIPGSNTQATAGDVISIYYASDDELVEVPSVIGWDVETAGEKLASMQLAINPKYTEKNSDKPKGEVIEQNPVEGDKVIPGTRISVVVSNGVPEKSKAEIKLILPTGNTQQNFSVYVNNETKMNTSMLMDGVVYDLTVEGSGSDVPVKVYIGGSEYFTCTVDFTKSPAVVTNERYSSSGTNVPSRALPNVVGKQMTDAQSILKNAGFINVRVEYRETQIPSENGMVINQIPGGSLVTMVPADTTITIYVGQSQGI